MSNYLGVMENKKVFLDTAFLASFSIEGHKDFSNARKLLANLVLKKSEMYISPLCFYELWQVVKEYNDFHKGNYRIIRKINGLLKYIYLKILFNEINFSYKQIIDDLQNCTHKIIQSKFISIVNLENDSIDTALHAIDKFDTKPGDSFHFSTIKKLNINTIITGNRKEFERMGLNVIWF